MEKLNRLAEIMARDSVKGQDLAEKIGVSTQTVSNWKTNVRQPSLERIYDIAKALEIEPAELLVKTNDNN